MLHYKIFKVYLNYLIEKNKFDKSRIFQNGNRKMFLHLFKSNRLILFTVQNFFLFINILSLLIKFKFIFNLDNNVSNKFLSKIDRYLNIYTKRLNELFLAVIYVQDKNFNEKTIFPKINKKISNNNQIYDAIVIGSGPSGSITANKLKKKFQKVLLIDKGNYTENYSNKHPGNEFIYKWNNAGVDTTLINNQISFASASCLGGGSEINSGLLHFPDESFVNKWKKEFNVRDIDFKKFNNELKFFLDDQLPTLLTDESNRNIAAKLFLDGIKKSNYKFESLNKLEHLNLNKLKKSSMSQTLIRDYIKNNGEILIKFEVDKILKKDDLWEISGLKNKSRIHYKTKYLFICAGAIYTNQLLINNNLCKLHDTNYFKFHPMTKVLVQYNEKVQEGFENVHNIQITENYPNFLIGQAASGYQFLKIAAYNNSNLLLQIEENWKKMLIYHSTFSVGEGQIYNTPIPKNFIYGYKINKIYLDIFKDALKCKVDVLFNSGAKKIYFLGKKIIEINSPNDEYLSHLNHFKDFKISSVHLMGGVKSGESNECLVDSFGKLKKYENLFINDSSLINHKLLKNPQGTVMAISLRNINNFLRSV